ncbi:hypothetical protein M3Y95_00432100 [Aphelenchoides besseyi]|nr:hypothetical protein M3Y95_00432100 [Aphelenchoides besseyi]
MNEYDRCLFCVRYKHGLVIAAIGYIALSLFSASLVAVSLIRIENDLPHLIFASEMSSARQHALRLLFEWSNVRLAAFFVQQAVAVFVSVLLLIGVVTNTQRLFSPFAWFTAAAIVVNMFEIGEVVYSIISLETHMEIDVLQRHVIFRSLMEVAIARLLLNLPLAWSSWAAMRSTGYSK